MHPLFEHYSPERRVPLAIMASGSGTLMEAALAYPFKLVEPRLVIVDRKCSAQKVAEVAGVECLLLERTDFTKSFDRRVYTDALANLLLHHEIDLVAMMGFETVLDSVMFEFFDRRVLNSHPALLPQFVGAHAVRDAFEAGVSLTGTSIHIATPTVDDDAMVLVKIPVERRTDDTEDSLHERIKVQERSWYPRVIDAYAGGDFAY